VTLLEDAGEDSALLRATRRSLLSSSLLGTMALLLLAAIVRQSSILGIVVGALGWSCVGAFFGLIGFLEERALRQPATWRRDLSVGVASFFLVAVIGCVIAFYLAFELGTLETHSVQGGLASMTDLLGPRLKVLVIGVFVVAVPSVPVGLLRVRCRSLLRQAIAAMVTAFVVVFVPDTISGNANLVGSATFAGVWVVLVSGYHLSGLGERRLARWLRSGMVDSGRGAA